MIESSKNQWVKHVRRLQRDRRYRRQQGEFVVEGTRWFGEVSSKQELVTAVYHTPVWLESNPTDFAGIAAPITAVSDSVMAAMSETDSPPGILATVTIPPHTLPPTPTWLLILDRIADPGNLGTIIRTAAAAGIDGVVLSEGCVDLYNPKVVRSTTGALLHLPIVEQPWSQIGETITGLDVYGLDAAGEKVYTTVDWQHPFALVLGSEAHGLGLEALQLPTTNVAIPMASPVESLNAGVATAVVLYEAKRQREAR